jgi:anti-sigma regulatory factor (Ser/Thr protein kinase)
MIPLLHADSAESDPIKYVMSELVRNVLEHSTSPNGAFVCAQHFPQSKRVAIGVADSGQGILAHIRQHHKVNDDKSAILHALRPGITGTTSRIGGTETNAGAGLFFTRNIAKASNNMFVIYSGRALYKLRHPKESRLSLYADATRDPCSIHDDLPNWPGTAIGIDIATTRTRSFSALLQLIRQVYSVDVRQGQKAKYKKPRFIS